MLDPQSEWLEAAAEALSAEVCARILRDRASIFARVGEAESGALVRALLDALRADLASGGASAQRAAMIDLIRRLSPRRLGYFDLRLLGGALRGALLDGMAAAGRDRADERRIEDWLHELAFQSGLHFIAQRDEIIAQQATELEMRLAEIELAAAEKERITAEVIRKLSTPIAPVHEGVLVVPLIGAVDDHRARALMERLLEEIVRHEARFVILDVSGVDEFDEPTARYLLSAARAASLIGAGMVLSGISPTMARAMVTLAAPLGGLSTFRSLEDALRHALAAVGYRIARAAAS